jgi:hypothetical protein
MEPCDEQYLYQGKNIAFLSVDIQWQKRQGYDVLSFPSSPH